MQEARGTTHSVPSKHRIALALSTAFLVHTLLLSGFPSPISLPDEPHHRVEFELVSPGTVASAAREQAVPTDAIQSRNPRFEVAPDDTGTATSTPRLTARASEERAETAEPTPQQDAPRGQRRVEAATAPATPAHQSQASAASQSGSPAPRVENQRTASLRQITESPSERDPYLIELAVHLGHELERLSVPAISQLSEKVAMEIELQLLGNGALTRARILKSTGIKRIDDAAYRASLAASPYPEPPDNTDSQSRFEVELVFSPNRL